MKQVNDELIKYIIDNIIPQYSDFDKAHNIDHVKDVIKNSMDIAERYDVNANMVFTIAAYHDIGIRFGREKHNITSAGILSNDNRLKKWFCDEQIEVMKKAIEDHRASNNYEPRSIYGKIVSEADRCMDSEK